MRTSGNTVLITGGATGIGFAIAEKLVGMGNTVIICGRREEKLDEAKKRLPGIQAIRCDISREDERARLHDSVCKNFGDINILINNAGIQRRIDLKRGMEDILKNEDEIEINLRSQIYLSARFVPALLQRGESAIVNVSSGLGFVPLAMFPIYCATKAAIHSFTMSLRHQLRDSQIKVFEVIPSTVYDTELKGKPIEKTDWTVSAEDVAAAVVDGIGSDEYEIAVGPAKAWTIASRGDIDRAFKEINH
jgi:uncharacterized oxidoreductase